MNLGTLPAERLFVVSDTHFGHANICKYSGRPWSNVADMNAAMVDLWNQHVPDDAVVLHCGDFQMGLLNEETAAQFSRLKGTRKILVAGNHDQMLIKRNLAGLVFHEVYDNVRFRVGGDEFYAQHYPCEEWRETYHLHGHQHERGPSVKNRLNVNMDAVRVYMPLSFEEVMERMPR